jgi:hypothetical protein
MAVVGDINIKIDRLAGVNQNEAGRLPNELRDCENIIGEESGFSVFKGRKLYLTPGISDVTAITECVWPDEHDSLVMVGTDGIEAKEAGTVYNITGDLTFSSSTKNPTYLTKIFRARYLVGSNYLRDQAWYWDGIADHAAKELPVSVGCRVLMDWGNRLWSIGAEDHPLYSFFGEIDALEITGGNWYEFRNNPRATRLVGCRPYNLDTSFFWGDYGLWVVSKTNSWPLFAQPTLISGDCDCVSNASITALPGGGGFVWMGKDRIWMYAGGKVQAIDTSDSGADRLRESMKDRSYVNLYQASAFDYTKRGLIIFSYDPWSASIAWDYHRNTWWPLSQGWRSVVQVRYLNENRAIGTDTDGKIYLIDENLLGDKAATTHEWYADFGWFNAGKKAKWLIAKLTRKMKGTNEVTVDFYDQYQATPSRKEFSMTQKFDAAATHPSYDPGGPDDLGVPPEPVITSHAHIDFTGQRVKVKLSGTSGPKEPMISLEVIGRSI